MIINLDSVQKQKEQNCFKSKMTFETVLFYTKIRESIPSERIPDLLSEPLRYKLLKSNYSKNTLL